MRGQVLGVDLNSGEGQIAGDDGRRYAFRPSDWGDRTGPAVGALVDFETNERRALSIYRLPVDGNQPVPAGVDARPARGDRNRIVAALLAFFLGLLGVHRFYLGRNGSGIAMLVLTITMVGIVVSWPWSFVDFIRYLVMADEEFDARYNYRR